MLLSRVVVTVGCVICAIVDGYVPVYFTCVPEAMFWTGYTAVAPDVALRTVKA